MSEDHEFATLLQEGQGYERCYDALAPALYRYCWTLLGPRTEQEEDAPAAAVRETFLAAVELLPHLKDRDLFRSWLFALARAVCQQRGFATDAPYALLSVHAEEQPFAEALRALPPSQRELLELSLRHGLSHTQIAVVLGLDPETVSDLCRSAAQRVADLLTEKHPDDGRSGSRWIIADIPSALISIALPGPPRRLREQVIADCADAAAASRREAAGALVRPLGGNGFPLQRVRGSDSDPADATGPAAAADPTEYPVPDPALPPADAEPLSELASVSGDGRSDSEEPHRLSGWLLPATAGLVTALIAFSLWGLGAFLGRSGDTVVGAPPPVDGLTASPMSDHAPESTEPDSGGVPPAEVSEPTFVPPPAVEETGAADQGNTDGGTGSTGGAPSTGGGEAADPPAPAPQAPAPEPQEEPVSEPQPAPADTPAPPQEETESPRRPGSGVTSLLEGVLGLLGLDRDR